jgi:hypothetical protein
MSTGEAPARVHKARPKPKRRIYRDPRVRRHRASYHDQFGTATYRNGKPRLLKVPFTTFWDQPGQRCAGTTKQGTQCGSWAVLGSDKCRWHGGGLRRLRRLPCTAKECAQRYPHRWGSKGCARRDNRVIAPAPTPPKRTALERDASRRC